MVHFLTVLEGLRVAFPVHKSVVVSVETAYLPSVPVRVGVNLQLGTALGADIVPDVPLHLSRCSWVTSSCLTS